MAFTDFMKNLLMDDEQFDASSKWVALGRGANANSVTELSGNGYGRGEWDTDNMAVAADGGVTGDAFTVYTASGSSAVQAQFAALFDSETGGNRLTDWESISSPPAAPADGQAVRITPSVTP